MEFLKRLAKLIDVKSIISLSLTIVFCVLAAKQIVPIDKFFEIYLVIIAFYFGTQFQKNKKEEE